MRKNEIESFENGLFKDELIEEYVANVNVNPYPYNFNWWKFVNLKTDLDTALAFAKFYCPDILIVDSCFILKDKYTEENFNSWRENCNNNKTNTEKMMNLYTVRDFFHINRKESENEEDKVDALGRVLKCFWDMSFKQRFPDKEIIVNVFEDEYDRELFITVYEAENIDVVSTT